MVLCKMAFEKMMVMDVRGEDYENEMEVVI